MEAGAALLGVLRGADAIVYCCRAAGGPDELEAVRDEIEIAGIDKPAIVAATQADEADERDFDRLREAFSDLELMRVSILDDASLDAVRAAIWRLTGLIRVYLRSRGETDDEPLALPPHSTVADVAHVVHHELAARASGARLWGPSARFAGQRVGRTHALQDGDVVEIVS